MGITVKNNSSNTIEVAVNHWGSDGDTSFFSIANGKQESWDRSDSRGFVLSLKKNGAQHPYYVQASSRIEVDNNAVKDQGQPIQPLS
ncbi:MULTISPECIES: hypothetical protein [Pseudomonas]|uniref:Uncharacterized protein n=1 Tax=Pseudomonas chlororaphis TaxID=587753 RepID=A0AAX3G369_9PSED|nr:MULTISPECIES: hypothetical protein [Pseudomonas]AZC36573.1 hypothetical protein C4K37_2186 [Pseudomonas chlororaphis subsp. piscium]AZC43118.1 hypothetical protein C4K36_2193 [Pseudomonas chlororaphis subsp. piscium]AZC49805.1 hypothetical protein C4K35_2222 [Pseudomonas chlororaphis subsp. piscium]AZC56387.1 hypothetical protein C4K34_2222 [Pseudomonas chlororaphis subsp. piscium]AZC62597.1 hypothetical protein C4K33_2105 [Pseudomonas chlororaphis subsp. piscium]